MTKFREVLGNAKVFYRIYPSENPDWGNFRFLGDGKTIQLHLASSRMKEVAGEKIFKQFETDGYFYNVPQGNIYSVVMEGVIESVFQGQNAIIAVLGQTGSGKSLTIGGFHYFYQDRGLIPRIIENIFSLKEKLPKNLEMLIHISYIEVLSSFQCRDLLKPYPSPIDKIDIHKGVWKMEVKSDLQTLQYVYEAEGRKEYTPDTNHPSHVGSSILTFEFTIRDFNFTEPHEFISKVKYMNLKFFGDNIRKVFEVTSKTYLFLRLHIIDLAGNDNFGDRSSTFKKYWQVGSANCTKSFMEHFMLLLCGNDPVLAQVKKRTNVVSQYLGETFNRGSIMRFIGHLKTSKDDLNIALSLLKFGQLFKTMGSECTRVVLKDNVLVKIATMEEKLNNLNKEKLIMQMLQNQEPKSVCPQEFEYMKRMVGDFVHNQIDGSHLLKMGDIFTILKIMKENIIAHEENEMINKSDIVENIETKVGKLENENSLQAAPFKSSEIGPRSSNMSQQLSGRESLKGVNMKKTSSQTRSKKQSMENDNRSITTKRGKISTGSLNGMKRSSTIGKKKGGGAAESSGSTEKTSKKAEAQQNNSLLSAIHLVLPEVIPEQKEALKEYVNSPKTNYKTLLETFRKYDTEAKEIYQNYLKELKKLDSYFEILDLRKNEVVQTKLVTQFSRKQEKDSRGNVIKSELEERCRENLQKAERDVAIQQEVVLNYQADFKIALSMTHQIKNEIKEEFEAFCKEKYVTPIQNLEDLSEFALENEINIQELMEQVEDGEVQEGFSQEQVYEEIYKNLKEIMHSEARKKAQYLRKSIKWIDNTRFSEKL